MIREWLAVGAAEFALDWLVQSTLLLAFGLAAGRVLRRAGSAVQSTVYRTTLVAVLLCPAAAMLLATAGFEGQTIRLPGRGRAETSLVASNGPAVEAVSGMHREIALDDGINTSGRPAVEAGRGLLRDRTPDRARTTVAPAPPARAQDRLSLGPGVLDVILQIGLAVWVTGSVALALRLFVALRWMGRLRSGSIRAAPDAEALCAEIARGMGLHPPAVLITPLLSSPCLYSLRRPVVLLPEDVRENLRDTFVHELAHLARGDASWNLLRVSVSVALWVQPLVWVLSRRLEATAEEVCDDVVVQSGAERARYASHLLDLADQLIAPVAPLGAGMIALRSLLARRVVRILDSSRALSTRAGARVVVATLCIGVAGTLLASLIGIGETMPGANADEPPKVKSDAISNSTGTTKPETRHRVVRGLVVDPEGRPVAGATVTAARYRPTLLGPPGLDEDRQELVRTLTGGDGRFELAFEELDPGSIYDARRRDDRQRVMIVASASSFGPCWADAAKLEGEPLTLVLARDDVPVTGRVIDLEGRPVGGVDVQIYRLCRATDDQAIDRWLKTLAATPAGARRDHAHTFPIASERGLARTEPALPRAVTSDAEGRFRLAGLGRDRLAIVDVAGPATALRRIEVVTRRMAPVEGRPVDISRIDAPAYHGADCTIVAAPARPIEGVVRDRDTKAPIPGATVTAMSLAGLRGMAEGVITSTTDEQGRYNLVGMPSGSGHRLSVYPPLDRPYFITQLLEVAPGPGLGPIKFDIDLKRGLWIHGRVTDARTGQPLPAQVEYYPFLANEHAKDFANFRSNSVFANWSGDRYRTGAEGRFRVLGIPGRGIVAVRCDVYLYRLGVAAEAIPEKPGPQRGRLEALPTYNLIHPRDFHALAVVDPAVGAEEFHRDLALEPGSMVPIRLVDPDGRALRGVQTAGCSPTDLEFSKPLADDWTRIFGREPGQTRVAVFLHRERKLGMVFRMSDALEAGERTVVLRPCAGISARLVDGDGKPVSAAVSVRLQQQAYGGRYSSLSMGLVHVAEDGRFRHDLLPPGGPYEIWANDSLSGRTPPARFRSFSLTRSVTADSGQVIDLGTFDVTTGRRVEAPQ